MLDRIPFHLKLLALVGFVFTGPVAVVSFLLLGVWGVIGAILAISLVYIILYFVVVKQHL